jgi:hypothetical protein
MVLFAAHAAGALLWQVAPARGSRAEPARPVLMASAHPRPGGQLVPPAPALVPSYDAAAGERFAPAAGMELAGEISLQEALDRLGYTVNVPTSYAGRPVLSMNGYRESTRDDSVSAALPLRRDAAFTQLSQQAMLAGTTTFGITGARGEKVPLLRPVVRGYGLWLSRQGGPSVRRPVVGAAGFYIQDRSDMFRLGALTSEAGENRDGASHLLVLPARTGGTWVDEGNNTGHWEGGADAPGAYLLCWEDSNFDTDFQDMVVLVEGAGSAP